MSRPGFVYLMRRGDGAVKIGCARRVARRKRDLEDGRSGGEPGLTLLHRIATNDMDWLEGELHQRYVLLRVEGEWFALDAAALGELLRVRVRNREVAGEGASGRSPTTFPERVLFWRVVRGMSVEGLAAEAHVPLATIVLIETGRVTDPRFSLAVRLADALGVNVGDLAARDY